MNNQRSVFESCANRLMFIGLLIALTPVTAPAASARSAGEVVPNLEAFCRSETVQSAVAKLSPTITVKEIGNPGGPVLPGGAKFTAAAKGLPAYCQVTGSFVTNPNTGKTANFLATFPATWNGKYLQMGCSAYCGQFAVSNAATPTVTVTNQGYPGQILQKGYASFATDEGHEGFASGTWALKASGKVDEDAIEDFLYRADKVLARVGKEFTVAFYGQATKVRPKISRSYFSGCSEGGRDAFVAASYFPEEFDGIIGGSAANLIGVALHGAGAAIATLRTQDAEIPPTLLSQIDPIVKAKCDKLDGLEDGLIQNPAACDFRPERDLPRCQDNKPGDQCFTQAQIETLSTVLTAVTDEEGNVVQPGYSVSELQAAPIRTAPRPTDLAALDPWPNSDNGQRGGGGGLWTPANAALKIFVHKNDPNFETRSLFTFRSGGPGPVTGYHIVVPKAEVAALMTEGRMGVGHVPENAAKLIKLNRKFLIWHNSSDQLLPPYLAINYYVRLAKLHGGYDKLQSNVRLFTIPGSTHCSMAGVGPNNFDALTAMEEWVEKGKGPDALVASLYDPRSSTIDMTKKPLRTMPLCKFPEMAHYSGQGPVNDAANWTCPAGDKSMLKIGESGKQAGMIEQ